MNRIIRKSVFAAALLAAAQLTHDALAAGTSYTPGSLAAARDEGKTIVLEFHAPWCGTCRKQTAALSELAGEQALASVVFLKADFDSEKALRKELRVGKQSTLVVFKGAREIARATGTTAKDELRNLIEQGL